MPNHFHFLVCANERSNLPHNERRRRSRNKPLVRLTHFSWGLKHLLSSYARGTNHRFNRTGSLFQQNTKAKRTSNDSFCDDYSLWCFIYIHNNPVVAGIVTSPDEYEFTSYRDYLENREDSICNLALGRELFSLDINEIFECRLVEVPVNILRKIFR